MSGANSTTTMQEPEPACGGCGRTLESASGGVVVAFGNALWHVECFRCAKCQNTVSADTNLLLLADGSPVCQACSYSCHVCHNPILDEAIMTGDDSYHASCFKCRTCSRRIEELVFAKTSQGIYCMACHNDRVARSRRHADKKRSRTKSRKEDSAPQSRATDFVPSPAPHSLAAPHDLGKRRKSYDDGVRPLSAMFAPVPPRSFAAQQAIPPGSSVSTPGGLSPSLEVPHLNADKRGSIRPRGNSTGAETGRLSPYSTEGLGTSSRAPSPSLSLRDEYLRGRNIKEADSTRGRNTSQARDRSTQGRDTSSVRSHRPYEDHGEITMMLEEPTFVLEPSLSVRGSHPEEAVDDEEFDGMGIQGRGVIDERSRSPSFINSPTTSMRGPSPAPIITKSASQGVPTSTTKSPAVSKSASQGAAAVPGWKSNGGYGSTTTTPNGAFSPSGYIPSPGASSYTASPITFAPPANNGYFPSTNGNGRTTPNNNGRATPTTQGSVQFPSGAVTDTPTPRRSRESVPPPAVPPKGHHPHQHSMSVYLTNSGSAGSGSLASTAGTNSLASTTSATTPTRRPPARSSSSSSSSPAVESSSKYSPVIESTATYGAMQLPPMRFSLSDTDFADLLKGVGFDAGGARNRLSLIGLGRTSLDGVVRPVVDGKENDKEQGGGGEDKDKPRGEDKSRVEEKDKEKERSLSRAEDKSQTRTEERSHSRIDDKPRERRPSESSKLSRPSVDSVRPTTPAPRPSISSSTDATFVSVPDIGASTTGPVLDEDDFGQSTPIIRTTLAPPTGSTRERADSVATDNIMKRLKEMSENAQERGSTSVKINLEFLEAITKAVVGSGEQYRDLKGKYDGMKRTSQQFIDGLSVAQSEYDKELAARREAEAEVTRLRVQLQGQTARLTALTADTRIKEVGEQQLADANGAIRNLLRDVAKLKTERDMIVSEIDELGKKTFTSSGEGWESLESRLENLRKQYRKDLEGLKLQREGLFKEITELKEHRDIFLEETTALNARNEELAELNAQIQRQVEQQIAGRPPMSRMDSSSSTIPTQLSLGTVGSLKEFGVKNRPGAGATNGNGIPSASVSSMGTATGSTVSIPEDRDRERDSREDVKRAHEHTTTSSSGAKGGFKWLKGKPGQGSKSTAASANAQADRPKGFKEHNFVPQSVLRFARCDQCGDKMWGMQMRCSHCNFACHQRCTYLVKPSCQSGSSPAEEPVVDISPLPPSMFGRDLIEQVRSDSKSDPGRMVPFIVDKCIRAVEASAMDYEGIYRKTGGTTQSKAIIQLFEKGDYAFDLEDTDSFNDISSITSVLKSYFRQLPVPLLTFALHEGFVEAAGIRDTMAKHEALVSLVRQLPLEHYHTLRCLMLHLSRVKDCSDENLMSARNIGVVFGPTLMRSSDPAREFGDMAGKALTVEWLVENAPTVFSDLGS
ncbi:putative Rho-type GTPase-activating protein 4 OS=Schizosaccharomyces pombe (strain 972 / ATCC 24843) GN=rga4 PE=1 SV=2 [Rhizoctonia solani AG-1 IB]|uniref:Putative Rho-type GTPase-activating protein 4 n=1 Tax=Thanatephorus cucumeris (strain AG1-IB / isolate 7/3/14) TaxID=1108050 RepID=A0A0B7FXY4_THACB|nr:putative Rho-type GTPase-activating protein 4 OS=Schizosaccharomyces pombe (strain 972 / ATCC 24843) GN=rga4 PE=1 SV=2 [Rhizoctonia solani AG-1 IB]